MIGRASSAAITAALALSLFMALPAMLKAEDAKSLMEPLPLTTTGQPVPGYPNGAPATLPSVLQLTPIEIERLKAGKFKAGIAMQALDTPWNSLQVEAITNTLMQYGIEVVAVTDAAQNPSRQAAHLASLIDRKVNVIFSVPIDPATPDGGLQAGRGRRHQARVHGQRRPRHGAGPRLRDGRRLRQREERGLRDRGADQGDRRQRRRRPDDLRLRLLLFDRGARGGLPQDARRPSQRALAATDRFTQPREVYDKTIAMLRANPNIKGIFAVWGDPAMQAVAAAKAIGRSDVVVTTNDLGPDTALYVARGEILAIGAQLPYDLGVAEANAAAFALLGKPVPPYISLPALRVKKANLLSALELVTKRPAPQPVRDACGDACQ